MKSRLKAFFFFIITLLILSILVTEIFGDKLVNRTIDTLSGKIEADVSYDHVNVQFIRSFPFLTISFRNFAISTNNDPEDRPFFTSESIKLQFGLRQLLRLPEKIRIRKVILDKSDLQFFVSRNRKTNYDILKESAEETQGPMAELVVDQFRMEHSHMGYRNEPDQVSLELEDMTMESQIFMTPDSSQLKSQIASNARVSSGAGLSDYSFRLETNPVIRSLDFFQSIFVEARHSLLNGLEVDIEGSYNQNDSSQYKASFNTDTTSLKEMLSLIPAIYKNNYASFAGEGEFVISGMIEDNKDGNYPRYNISMSGNNGVGYYPGNKSKLEVHGVDVQIKNDGSSVPFTLVNISNLRSLINDSEVAGAVKVQRNAVGYDVQSDLSLDLNLEDLEDFLFDDELWTMSGTIAGSLLGNGTILTERGTGSRLRGIRVSMQGDKIMYTDSAHQLTLEKSIASGNLHELSFELDKVHYNDALIFDTRGTLRHLQLSRDTISLTGNSTLDAALIDLNYFTSQVPDTTAKEIVIPKIQLEVTLSADKIHYLDHEIYELNVAGELKNVDSKFSFSIGSVAGNSITGDAELHNLPDYTINNELLTGNLILNSEDFDLNAFSRSQSGQNVNKSTQILPGNLDLNIDYDIQAISFAEIEVLQSIGQVTLTEGMAEFSNTGTFLGGPISFSGSFSDWENESYGFGMDLKLSGIPFAESLEKMELLREMIPIEKIIQGQYSAELNWSSRLDSTFFPIIPSVSAFGFIQTANGRIAGQIPFADYLHKIVTFREKDILRIADTKKYFVIEDGSIVIKDLKAELDGIKITMSGMHGFDQTMNYTINTLIPGSKVRMDELIRIYGTGFDIHELVTNARQNFDLDLTVRMSGTTIAPAFDMHALKLMHGGEEVGVQSTVEDVLKEQQDSIEKQIIDTLSIVRDTIAGLIDSVTTVLSDEIEQSKAQLDSTIISLEDLIREKEEEIKEEGNVLLDSLRTGNIDSLQNRIEDLFKRKISELDSVRKNLPVREGKGSKERNKE